MVYANERRNTSQIGQLAALVDRVHKALPVFRPVAGGKQMFPKHSCWDAETYVFEHWKTSKV